MAESLKDTIKYINEQISSSAKASRSTVNGQPIGTYGLIGFTVLVIGTMIFRNIDSNVIS